MNVRTASSAGRAALAIALSGVTTLGALAGLPIAAQAAPVHCTTSIASDSTSGVREVVIIPASSTGSRNCTLSLGDHGDGVYFLQETLNSYCNHPTMWIDMDGQFGPDTRRALIAMQTKYRITADGIYGPNTRKKLLWEEMGGAEGDQECYHVS